MNKYNLFSLLNLLIILSLVLSCKESKKLQSNQKALTEGEKLIEEKYVVNDSFSVGGVRRYGVVPNRAIITHPVSNKNCIQTALDHSEEIGIELFFPKGFYNSGLILDSRIGIKATFNKSEFSDVIHITNEGGKNSKNKRGLRSRGCHIYTNTFNLNIGYLEIDDLGSDHINNHAALAIDSYPHYPKEIKIDKAIINSSDRHGVYLMGFNHQIDTLIINDYGQGSKTNMSLMQGVAQGEELDFTGIWFNECYNTKIDYLEVNQTSFEKGDIDVNFDIGDKNYPITINQLKHKFSIVRNRFSGDNVININAKK